MNQVHCSNALYLQNHIHADILWNREILQLTILESGHLATALLDAFCFANAPATVSVSITR